MQRIATQVADGQKSTEINNYVPGGADGKGALSGRVRNPGVSYLQLEAGCMSMGHSTAGAQTSKSGAAHE